MMHYMHFLFLSEYRIMKLLIWNVNGLRSISKKEVSPGISFDQFIKKYDIVVLNETKIGDMQMKQNSDLIPNNFNAYHSHSSTRNGGYAGVSILTKILPIKRIDPSFSDNEGRLVILEYKEFILIGVYVPNAGPFNKDIGKPKRHRYRTKTWDIQFQSMCANLRKKKPLIILGDMNVANEDIDVYGPTKLTKHAGFTSEERKNFKYLLDSVDLIDIWRNKHPLKTEYTFFDYRSRARIRNAGWRIDYALISSKIYPLINSCIILSNIIGSDHIPLELKLQINL